MKTDLISLMSNEALRKIARFGVSMHDIAPRYRFDVIAARRELDRRDMMATVQ